MENNTAMLGGESAKGYFRNSKFQREAADETKSLFIESILDSLELVKDSRVVTIADLGCSVGPSTFSTVSTVIEAVKIKCKELELEVPEFHVFFNDQFSNDFNTLFRALPEDREYSAAGVPGSFHGRLFPTHSINLMNSTMALHWITKLPDSLCNRGRITFAWSSGKVMEAFKAQFYGDVKAFLTARSQELVPGGLLAIHFPSRPEGTSPAKAIQLHLIECFGDILNDMVKEGTVREELVDSFNMPWFFPTASEMKEIVGSAESSSHLIIEKVQEIKHETRFKSQEDVQVAAAHMRAVMECILSQHFGTEVADDLFIRYPKKLRDFMISPAFLSVQESHYSALFMVLKHNGGNVGSYKELSEENKMKFGRLSV